MDFNPVVHDEAWVVEILEDLDFLRNIFDRLVVVRLEADLFHSHHLTSVSVDG